jgi:hypothetical protein
VKAHYQLLGKPEGRLPPLKPALLFGVFVIVWRGGALALERLSNKPFRPDRRSGRRLIINAELLKPAKD